MYIIIYTSKYDNIYLHTPCYYVQLCLQVNTQQISEDSTCNNWFKYKEDTRLKPQLFCVFVCALVLYYVSENMVK